MDSFNGGNQYLYQEDVPVQYENAKHPLYERNLKLVDSNRMTVVIGDAPIDKAMAQKLGMTLEFMAMFLNPKAFKLGEPLPKDTPAEVKVETSMDVKIEEPKA